MLTIATRLWYFLIIIILFCFFKTAPKCNWMTQASDLLLKMHFTTVDVDKLKEWLAKWPFGTSKDGFGLPKTMLPMHAAVHHPGVKISFKGTPDPWLQVLISPTPSDCPHASPSAAAE
jgi:hypothetical protein